MYSEIHQKKHPLHLKIRPLKQKLKILCLKCFKKRHKKEHLQRLNKIFQKDYKWLKLSAQNNLKNSSSLMKSNFFSSLILPPSKKLLNWPKNPKLVIISSKRNLKISNSPYPKIHLEKFTSILKLINVKNDN